jgi:hypothetical protein
MIMQKMVSGLRIVKFHYTKKLTKEMTLKLSSDYSSLTWEYENQNKFYKYFKKREIKISDIQAIIYGPFSHTFLAYRLQTLLKLP